MITKIIISFLVFITTISIHAQWVSKKDTLQLPKWSVAYSIDALSSDTVVISINPIDNSYSGLFLTENKGLNWIEIPGGEGATDISICSKSSIWTATAGLGKIYKTTDKGVSWEEQFYDTTKTKFINYIEMFDDNKGIAMGDAVDNNPALFINTNNGGNNWNVMNNNLYGYISGDTWRRLGFVDINNGYFSRGNDNLLKTSDGGSTWEKTNYTGGVQILKFYNQNIGLIFSYKYDTSTNPPTFPHFFRRTTDGGDTWEEYQVVDSGSYGNDIEFVPGNPSNVWFTNYDGLFFSIDTGRTWQEYDLGIDTVKGRDIVFTDANHGWLLCDNGNIFYTDNNGGIVTGIEEESSSEKIPNDFILYQNYPNPFNPSTKIKFTFPNVADANFASAKVQLIVYDLLGRESAVLVNEEKKPGVYEVEFDANNLSSGIYYYKLTAGGFAQTKKMILLK